MVRPMETDLEHVRTLMNELLPFNRFLGIRVVELQRGFAHLTIPFAGAHRRSDAASPAWRRAERPHRHDRRRAVFTVLEAGDFCVTVDLRVDYLEAGGRGPAVPGARRAGGQTASRSWT